MHQLPEKRKGYTRTAEDLKNTYGLGRSMGKKALSAMEMEELVTKERKKAYKESVLDGVKYFAKQYRNVESQFARKIEDKSLQLVNDEKKFKGWENEAAEYYNKMKKYEFEANFANRYERDRIENISTPKVENTIEVYSGNFFEDRKDAIIEALNNAPKSEKRTENLNTVASLEEYALKHLWAVQDYKGLRQISARAYADHCKDTHNALIECLNTINSIAREHHVTPLTFRDFETNEYYYDKKEDPAEFTDARAEYDRAIVEKYCEKAFSSIGDTRDNLLTTEVASSIAEFHRLGED